ncbi:hypothetical protein [uncultured Lamprocystis sp.]|uniref:hypothetical protein n=1 Tax=uncultured Lamprocystis sp. TaxID=543132 RepID=UPI0025E312B1|nr:hypothetical protein [uncultured Lamprocystis sp.]
MFRLIETHIRSIVGSIPAAHVRDYDWLVENIDRAGESEYQSKYRAYWAMNAARLGPSYYQEYFGRLAAATDSMPTLGNLAGDLYKLPTHRNERQSLQFSFATKLIHMKNRRLPIYDSQIAAFYFFREPARTLSLGNRISQLESFHGFLRSEYARILANDLLAASITAFRAAFLPVYFTDEKVIDSLLWAFVSRLRSGATREGSVIYS